METRSGYTVHPRMGGEQTVKLVSGVLDLGSSPHGRGTGRHHHAGGGGTRFIPAWAGNRRDHCSLSGGGPVHPRMGGEQIVTGGL